MRAATRRELFKAGSTGKNAVISGFLLAKVDSDLPIDDVKEEYRLARIARYLNLRNRREAIDIYSRPVKRRTPRQERAINSAKVALSLLLKQTNVPNQRNGRLRSPKSA
jgi:hypothetical protein